MLWSSGPFVVAEVIKGVPDSQVIILIALHKHGHVELMDYLIANANHKFANPFISNAKQEFAV